MKRVSSRQLNDLARKNNMPMCKCGCEGVARDTYNFYRDLVLAIEELNKDKKVTKKIVTTHVYPPIGIRAFDWCAYFEGDEEDATCGFGYTEEEAIAALLEYADD